MEDSFGYIREKLNSELRSEAVFRSDGFAEIEGSTI